MNNRDKAFDYYLRIVTKLNKANIINGGYTITGNYVTVHNDVAQMSFTISKPLQPQLDRWFKLWID